MSGFRMEGSSTGNGAEVDSSGQQRVRLSQDITEAGAMRLVGREDEVLRVTGTGYLMVSIENMEFIDTVEGTSVNTTLWNQSSSGMTITQTDSSLNLNPTAVVTANAYALISSIQQFLASNTNPLYIRGTFQSPQLNLPTNATIEAGWGAAATNAAPTDGVFVRFSNGQANLVINNGGAETLFPFDIPAGTSVAEFFMYIYGTRVKMYLNNVRILDIPIPSAAMSLTNNSRNSIFMRALNGAVAPTTPPQVRLGQITVQNLNSPINKSHAQRQAGMGKASYQSPVAPYAQSSNSANSAAPAAATLSNTAPSYTTLGGQFSFAAVAGAETDYALFSYLVPMGFQLYVSEVDVSTVVLGAAINGTTPTVLQWTLATNSSAASLATVDGAGTWAPRRRGLGFQSFAPAAPIGTPGESLFKALQTPIVVEGGRYLHIIMKVVSGSATGSQTFRGSVGINGFFE